MGCGRGACRGGDAVENAAGVVGRIRRGTGGGGALEDHERAGFHAGGDVLRVAKHREIVAFLALGAGLHGGGGGAGQVHMAAVQYGVA